MTDRTNSWHRATMLAASIGGVLVLAVAWWALRPLTPAEIPILVPPTIMPDGFTPGDARTQPWNVVLWQPLREPPPVVAPPPPTQALTATLFAITVRDGQHHAALDLAEQGLHYLKAGDAIGELHVRAVDATGVDVTWHGDARRLELAQ